MHADVQISQVMDVNIEAGYYLQVLTPKFAIAFLNIH